MQAWVKRKILVRSPLPRDYLEFVTFRVPKRSVVAPQSGREISWRSCSHTGGLFSCYQKIYALGDSSLRKCCVVNIGVHLEAFHSDSLLAQKCGREGFMEISWIFYVRSSKNQLIFWQTHSTKAHLSGEHPYKQCRSTPGLGSAYWPSKRYTAVNGGHPSLLFAFAVREVTIGEGSSECAITLDCKNYGPNAHCFPSEGRNSVEGYCRCAYGKIGQCGNVTIVEDVCLSKFKLWKSKKNVDGFSLSRGLQRFKERYNMLTFDLWIGM